MDLKKNVEVELERNKNVLQARVSKPTGFQNTALVKARIIFAESALQSCGDAELQQALSKLRRTYGEG